MNYAHILSVMIEKLLSSDPDKIEASLNQIGIQMRTPDEMQAFKELKAVMMDVVYNGTGYLKINKDLSIEHLPLGERIGE